MNLYDNPLPKSLVCLTQSDVFPLVFSKRWVTEILRWCPHLFLQSSKDCFWSEQSLLETHSGNWSFLPETNFLEFFGILKGFHNKQKRKSFKIISCCWVFFTNLRTWIFFFAIFWPIFWSSFPKTTAKWAALAMATLDDRFDWRMLSQDLILQTQLFGMDANFAFLKCLAKGSGSARARKPAIWELISLWFRIKARSRLKIHLWCIVYGMIGDAASNNPMGSHYDNVR